MFFRVSMLDETVETRRPWRVSAFRGQILTVSKLFRYAPEGEYMCATGVRGARTLRCGENDYKVVLHRFPGAHLGPTILATTEKSKKNLKNIIDI